MDASTVAGLLRARAGDDRAGLRFEDSSWTWREVVAASAQRAALASALRRPGPFHVGVLLENVPEYLFWIGGGALAGAAVVGINPTRRGAELERDVAHTDCQLVVTDTAGLALLDGLDLGVEPERVLVVDSPDYAQHVATHAGVPPPDAPVEPSALLLLLFTSGTTGAPKAVRCTHGRLAMIAERVEATYELTGDDVCYCPMPLFHGNALMALWAPALRAGACVALPRKFTASGFLPDVRRFGATYFTYVGKALTYILATPERPDDLDNPLVRAFGNEASAQDIDAFQRRFGCRIVEGYGSSEGGATIQQVPGMPDGALGRAQSDATVVLDPATGEECPRARFDEHGRLVNADDAIGEIVNKEGAAGFEGYYENAEADAERTRDGWYWSGDLGYRDEDGWFYFGGRSADWLRVDGENFAAAPVERILARHRDVVVAAVYAVPDSHAGDQVMAALELRPGASLGADAFGEFLDEQADLGTKWAPRFVRITSSVPLTGSHKVVKLSLRRQRWECDDPVWWRPARGDAGYRSVTADDREAVRKEFAAHGRLHLLE
jgi:fatty-acyl-CoA synthase